MELEKKFFNDNDVLFIFNGKVTTVNPFTTTTDPATKIYHPKVLGGAKVCIIGELGIGGRLEYKKELQYQQIRTGIDYHVENEDNSSEFSFVLVPYAAHFESDKNDYLNAAGVTIDGVQDLGKVFSVYYRADADYLYKTNEQTFYFNGQATEVRSQGMNFSGQCGIAVNMGGRTKTGERRVSLRAGINYQAATIENATLQSYNGVNTAYQVNGKVNREFVTPEFTLKINLGKISKPKSTATHASH